MKQLKRWIGCLLVCSMVISMLPVVAFAETTEVASGTCGENLTWTLDDEGVLTISGSGAMKEYSSKTDVPWYEYRNSIINLVVNDGVSSIGNYALYDCRSLTSVELPESITSIGQYAFYWCSSLSSVFLPEGMTTIGEYAFYNCYMLDYLFVPSTVDSIGTTSFMETGLTSAGPFGGGYEYEFGWIDYIPENAFSNSKITSCSLPESVTSIGANAFYNCQNLTSITIPENVTSIGDSAFDNCTGITEIFFDAIAMNNLEYDNSVFKDVGKDTEGVTATIGAQVTQIPDYLFAPQYKNNSSSYQTLNLTKVVFEEGSVCERIGIHAFHHCATLSEITLPESISIIDEHAFYNCSGLKEITIHENIQALGEYAFYGCAGLSTIYFNATDMDDLTGDTAYPYAFGNAGSESGSIIVYIGENVERIPDSLFKSSTSDCARITQVVFADNSQCTSIGSDAFCGCAYLTDIVIPSSVTTMGSGVFEECTNLTTAGPYNSGCNIEFGWSDEIPEFAFDGSSLSSVIFPANITSISKASFQNCNNLHIIEIPEGVTAIGDYAFNNCSNAEIITLPDGVTTIGEGAFMRCESATSITIPDSVKTIGKEAFRACTSLTNISISNRITEIEGFTFKECYGLVSVEIPYGVTAINNSYAFGDCTNLESVTIPSTVKVIGYDTFANCPALNTIYYGGTEEQWKKIEIYSGNEVLTGDDTEVPGATIHYSSGSESEGNDGSGGTGEGGNDSDGESTGANTYVRYFYEWDEENQIVYFNTDPVENPTNLGSQVTEETDTSFLGDIDLLVGHYVLAETKARDDGMIAPDTLISITLVETYTGNITEIGDSTIAIDGMSYPVAERLYPLFVSVGDLVMYHLYDSEIVGIELLESYSDSDSGSGDTTSPSYPEFDYGAEPDEPSNEEEILKIYAENWLEKYNSFIEAVRKEIEEIAVTEDAVRAAAIAAEASRMQKEDSGSNSKYITFTEDYPAAYKKEAYTALATLLYDEAADDFDFSSVDFDDESQGASLVDSVMRSVVGSSEEYPFDNITIKISIIQAADGKFGSLTCTVNNKNKSYNAVICSTQAEIEDTMHAFCDELQELGKDSRYNVYSAIAEDLLGKGLSALTTQYITEHVGKIESKFAIKLRDKFLELGVGDLIGSLQECHDYLVDMINPVEAGRTDDFEDCLIDVEAIDFKDADSKGTVKRKLTELNKAAEKLNNAVSDYLAGELDVSDFELFWKSTFNCPVNVAVFNSDGVQIGFVGEDDLWYEDSIVIEENGGSKTVYSMTNEPLSFEITGTAYGTMSCSFEEYDENNNIIGRLNYYDIAIAPNQEFTTTLTSDLLANSKLMAIRTENKSILADEYISVNESAGAIISCIVEADDGNIGGTVSGTGTYVHGDAVVLLAIPDDGYKFIGWLSEDTILCVNEVYEFTAREDTTLTAMFCNDNYVYVDVVAENGGGVIGDTKYTSGETATIIAIPDECYIFNGWYLNDELVSTEEEYQFVTSEDVIYVARFSLKNHSIDIPIFTWSEDFAACSASFVCNSCGDAQTVECIVTSETTPATETEAGATVYTATVEFNGQTYTDTKTVEIPATGHVTHITTLVPAVEATCEHTGNIAYYTCSGCDLWFEDAEATKVIEDHDSVTIPLADHSYESVVTAPICTEQGYTTHTCSVCGDSYVDAYVDATGHSFGEWTETKAATCADKGEESRSCACGVTETREIDALGHTAADAVRENEVAASCGTDGSYDSVVYCVACGNELSRETVAVPSTSNHNYVTEQERVEATCIEDGYVIMACGCGLTETTILPASGHSYESVVTDPTCTEQGFTTHTCSRCHDSYVDTYVDATGHTFENGVCAECGTTNPDDESNCNWEDVMKDIISKLISWIIGKFPKP